MNITLLQQFKKLIVNQIIVFEEYLKTLLGRIQLLEVKNRLNQVFNDLRNFGHNIDEKNDLKLMIADYKQVINQSYIAINNLLNKTIDISLIDDKTVTLYELDEIYNAAIIDINAINNVLHNPPNHSFIIRNIYNLQTLFERYKRSNYLKDMNIFVKKNNFEGLVNYLEHDFPNLNIEELFENVDVVYQIVNIIENITTYWNTFQHLVNINNNKNN